MKFQVNFTNYASTQNYFANFNVYVFYKEMQIGSGEGSTMRNFIVCTVYLILSGWLSLEEEDVAM